MKRHTSFEDWSAYMAAFGHAFTGSKPDVAAKHAERRGGFEDWDWPLEMVKGSRPSTALAGTRRQRFIERERELRGSA